ncbi:hypothetical protein M2137_000604 [Parabacteroides sp. PFB2-10]|uniref:hypothetical protein n=1 Tax=Parabacteroides sp. PFB2-10 TaxID=1742405 RepID=UPI002474A345|nr:hypothetical protein [Parabacteroides sp. PFB2-10]MDH6311845.1 hypothetical protein [Parabacteroides sp. PFB2-10]
MKGNELANDMNGLMPVQLRKATSQGEYVGLLQPWEILTYLEEHEINNPIFKHLKEEDNPWVVIISE